MLPASLNYRSFPFPDGAELSAKWQPVQSASEAPFRQIPPPACAKKKKEVMMTKREGRGWEEEGRKRVSE